MTPLDQLGELKNDEVIRKRLAKLIAHDCFRNTKKLEDMHAADRFSGVELPDRSAARDETCAVAPFPPPRDEL